MTKIIIISYFYPPSNFVGGDRVASWVKEFNKHGVFPIVITRNWNPNQKNVLDRVVDNEYKVEENEHCEIHRLPYKYSLRDRLALSSSFRFLSKVLTLKELIFSNYFLGALPYSFFYKAASTIISSNPEIKTVLISGGPFPQFIIGDKLAKKYGINWIADYRDEWTSHREKQPKTIIDKFIFNLQRKSELKVTKSASSFVTVSPLLKESIGNYINKPGTVIMNGFDNVVKLNENKTVPNELNLLYVGTLYMYQDMQPIVDAVVEVSEKTEFAICLTFVGVEIVPEAYDRLLEMTKDYPSLFKVLPRVSKSELVGFYEKSDLFYLSSYNENVGWLPVKLFEYYSLKKPILLYPSDKDVMESFIKSTKSGYSIDTREKCVGTLKKWINAKKTNTPIRFNADYTNLDSYSRSSQAKLLTEFILKDESRK